MFDTLMVYSLVFHLAQFSVTIMKGSGEAVEKVIFKIQVQRNVINHSEKLFCLITVFLKTDRKRTKTRKDGVRKLYDQVIQMESYSQQFNVTATDMLFHSYVTRWHHQLLSRTASPPPLVLLVTCQFFHLLCYAACNIVQYDRFGVGSVMIWVSMLMERHTDLYRLENCALSAIGYWAKFLGHCQTLCWCGGSWVPPVHYNARSHVASMQTYKRMEELIPMTGKIPLTWDIIFHFDSQVVFEFSPLKVDHFHLHLFVYF